MGVVERNVIILGYQLDPNIFCEKYEEIEKCCEGTIIEVIMDCYASKYIFLGYVLRNQTNYWEDEDETDIIFSFRSIWDDQKLVSEVVFDLQKIMEKLNDSTLHTLDCFYIKHFT